MDVEKSFKKVGTHDGTFHADEVMATAILKEIYEIEIIRTRNPQILGELDIVYDVGGGEFDHHGIDKVYREDGIPYAACGLIWKAFGREVIRLKDPKLNDEDIDSVFHYVDRSLIKGIDAVDNGIRPDCEGVTVMNISSIISGFNPLWYLEKNEDELFEEAVEVASAILKNTINRRFSILKSRENVVKAYNSRTIREVLVLEVFCPWGEILRDIDEKKEVYFVVYPRKDSYALQTVRGEGGIDKKPLPENWAGKVNEELASVTGVPDAVFCHTGRFMAVAKSYEGIMKMALLAVNEPVEVKEKGLFHFIKNLFSGKKK